MSLLEPYAFIMLVAYTVAAAVSLLTGYHPVVGEASIFLLGVLPALVGMTLFALVVVAANLGGAGRPARVVLFRSVREFLYTVTRMTFWSFGPLSLCVLFVVSLATASALASPSVGLASLLVASLVVPALLMPAVAILFIFAAVAFEAVVSLPFKLGASR